MKKKIIIIPGAPKCGSSNLFDTLRHHPEITIPRIKEPHFLGFNKDFVTRNFKWYENLFPEVDKIYLDGSTTYLYSSNFFDNVADRFEPYIIILLRDPVKRLFSQFNHMFKKLPKSLESRKFTNIVQFMAENKEMGVVEAENLLIKKSIDEELITANYHNRNYLNTYYGENLESPFEHPNLMYQYFRCSLYSKYVPKYLDRFGENVKIVFFEDWVSDYSQVLNELYEFLKIKKVNLPQSSFINQTAIPKNKFLRYVWYFRSNNELGRNLIGKVSKHIPISYKKLMRNMIINENISLSSDVYKITREILSEEYEYWFNNYPRLKNVWKY